jgi:hypothetical protein
LSALIRNSLIGYPAGIHHGRRPLVCISERAITIA